MWIYELLPWSWFCPDVWLDVPQFSQDGGLLVKKKIIVEGFTGRSKRKSQKALGKLPVRWLVITQQ